MKDIYLDYSATTKTNDEVLDTFIKVEKEYFANPNSLHKLGLESKNLIDAATNQIAKLLNVKEKEIIYTSGATEANNLAILGVVNKYKNRGKHIITTHLEHSSVNDTLEYLKKDGYTIDYVKLNEYGKIDLDDFKNKIRNDTVLVTICQVNSELGIIQDVNEIGKILKDYKTIIYHVDGTQAVGKVNINLEDIDLYTFSSHKIYGIKGIGALIKKENIEIDPIIHGGKSTTIYRAGTPTTSLIVSFSKALRLILKNINKNYEYVKEINKYLKDNLKQIDKIIINSNEYCIPHILNISIPSYKPETIQHILEQKNIYISTKTACSTSNRSDALYYLDKKEEISLHSLRISISYLTTKDEIDSLVKCLKECLERR